MRSHEHRAGTGPSAVGTWNIWKTAGDRSAVVTGRRENQQPARPRRSSFHVRIRCRYSDGACITRRLKQGCLGLLYFLDCWSRLSLSACAGSMTQGAVAGGRSYGWYRLSGPSPGLFSRCKTVPLAPMNMARTSKKFPS